MAYRFNLQISGSSEVLINSAIEVKNEPNGMRYLDFLCILDQLCFALFVADTTTVRISLPCSLVMGMPSLLEQLLELRGRLLNEYQSEVEALHRENSSLWPALFETHLLMSKCLTRDFVH